MDNIREKLVELLCEATTYIDDKRRKMIINVDHLIRHGVTVQEWIPVTERLPSDERDVLAYYTIKHAGDRENGMGFTGVLSYVCFDPTPHWQHEGCGIEVTHWMPLPTPPKGE